MRAILESSGLAAVLAVATACVHPASVPSTITAGHANRAELPAGFELLCWNIHKQRHQGFAAEFERFAAGVELVLLQEAIDRSPVWGFETAAAWGLVVAFEFGRERTATGVATGSTATPVGLQPWLSPGHEPFTGTPKSALMSWVGLDGGGVLMVVNLHGLNFRPARFLDAQLRALDEAIADHEGPLVVAGDFNTWSERRRGAVARFVARHRLTAAFVGAEAPRLDAVYTRGLIVHAADVLASHTSDHDALRVELELDPSAPR